MYKKAEENKKNQYTITLSKNARKNLEKVSGETHMSKSAILDLLALGKATIVSDNIVFINA